MVLLGHVMQQQQNHNTCIRSAFWLTQSCETPTAEHKLIQISYWGLIANPHSQLYPTLACIGNTLTQLRLQLAYMQLKSNSLLLCAVLPDTAAC